MLPIKKGGGLLLYSCILVGNLTVDIDYPEATLKANSCVPFCRNRGIKMLYLFLKRKFCEEMPWWGANWNCIRLFTPIC